MNAAAAAALTEIVAGWVGLAPELRGLALVGSWARGDPGLDSDLDLVVLSEEPEQFLGDLSWLGAVGLECAGYAVASHRCVRYGVVGSHHLQLVPVAEVELSFASLHWAATDPVAAGTLTVVRGGLKIIVDKDGLFRLLLAAVGQTAANDAPASLQ